jgi:DNA-3-methyladenine glycosylase
MNTILSKTFFNRPTLTVAQDLLGKYLVRQVKGQLVALEINEVEAYDGPSDRACHAARGKTPRTAVMFGPAGHFYVYFVYGVHWMLNIVTGREGYPAAILIRGAGNITGPARLTKFLGIDKTFNAAAAAKSSGLWIEDRGVIVPRHLTQRTPRIGVAYAGAVWAAKPYRFLYTK